jgi:RNA polymerase sigma-70 factor, ECF subfamily
MAIENQELAIRARAFSPAERRLEDLYASAQRRLVIQVAALTGDIPAAEDLVQDAFGRCAAKWEQVSGYDDPEAWVRAVAFNLARSRWRRLKSAARALARLGRLPVHPGPDVETVGLMIAVKRLPEDEREALVRHYLLDLPVAVVAEQLGVPEGTVKSRLARARARLATTLGMVDAEVDEKGDRNG